MQEEHGREKVEGDADHERNSGVGPCQRRKEGGKACDDHEGAEAAVGPAPPSDQPTEYVRESDPVHERGLHARLAHLMARQGERDVPAAAQQPASAIAKRTAGFAPGATSLSALGTSAGAATATSLAPF